MRVPPMLDHFARGAALRVAIILVSIFLATAQAATRQLNLSRNTYRIAAGHSAPIEVAVW